MSNDGERDAATRPPSAPPPPSETSPSKPVFQPRVEAEEGEPTRFDFVVFALVVVFLVVAVLWAFGVVKIPGINF